MWTHLTLVWIHIYNSFCILRTMYVALQRKEETLCGFFPDPSFKTFITKVLKRKTRKDKDYFVLRATIPKEVVNDIEAKPGDFLFFKVKKAEWYHLLNWKNMENAWTMLPDNVKLALYKDGISYPGASDQLTIQEEPEMIGATNPGNVYFPNAGQMQIYAQNLK